MKKVILMGGMALVLAFTAGCNREDGRTEIGVSLLTQSHPFYQSIKGALEKEASTQGVSLSLAIADQDLNRQLSAIEDFINKGVDLIILTPVDSDGVKGGILKAEAAGIPVITIDIRANDIEVATHIATDNYAGGRLAGEAMAQYLDYTGKVALITYPEIQSVRDRIDGFKDQISLYDGLEVVIELPGRTREEAKSTSEDMMTVYPDIDGIFGFGDDMAIAATIAVQERSSKAIVIGFDGMQEGRNMVDKDNAFKAVVMQSPEEIGRTAIKRAVQLLEGTEIPRNIPIVPGLYIYQKGEIPVSLQDNGKPFHIDG